MKARAASAQQGTVFQSAYPERHIPLRVPGTSALPDPRPPGRRAHDLPADMPVAAG